MFDIFRGTESFTDTNTRYWIGQVADQKVWATKSFCSADERGRYAGSVDARTGQTVYNNRVKVRVVGYHDNLDEEDLPWADLLANPWEPAGYGDALNTHQLHGGESVLGIWLDGEDEQKPMITNVFYRNQMAKDDTPNLAANDTIKPITDPTKTYLNQEETGSSDGTELATGQDINKVTYSIPTDCYDRITGNLKSIDCIKPQPWNEPSGDGSSMTNALKRYHQMLDQQTESPTCKRDNAVGAITGILGDFSELLLDVEAYGEFYVSKLTGFPVDLNSEINLISKKVGGYVTAMTNGARDSMFSQVEDKVEEFTNSLVPEELKGPFGEGLKGVMNNVYCLFENVIGGLLGTVEDFLKSLIGNFINAPLCAAEQIIGTLLNNIMGGITSTIGPILNSLTSTLGGALGSVNSIINQALSGVGLLYNFIGCDEFKCPLPSRFSNKYGPSQGERDNVDKLMGAASLLSLGSAGGLLGAVENVANVPSVFKKQGDGTPGSIASLVGGCQSNVLRCGPPKIEFFGGAGVGGFANAVVNNIGEIIGADILDPGLGFTKEKPPYVTFRDACGDGNGARGRAIIGDDGGIEAIVMDYPGYGYKNVYDKIKTIYGDIDTDATNEQANSDNKSVTGRINDVIVAFPGYGYNEDDTIEVDGNAKLKPIVLGGRVVGVEIIDPGTGFTGIPDIDVISETGIGASLKGILTFTNVEELSETVDPAGVISVVNCVGKPITRTRLG